MKLFEGCPTCKAKELEDLGDGIHFACSRCGMVWLLDDLILEYEEIQPQKKMTDFLNLESE